MSNVTRKHTALPKARILIEALPWLTRHNGKTVVIKFGGNAMVNEELKAAFAQDVVFLRQAGLKPVVVHGGGPQISAALDRHGIISEFKAGLRVTTEDAMDVVRMVLAGQVQRELVGLLNQHGPLAVGMTGEDAHTITATKHQPEIDGELVDIGRVGEITAIDTGAIEALLADGRIRSSPRSPGARTTDMSTTSMLIRRLRLSLRHWAPKPSWSSRTSRASTRTGPTATR